MTGAEEVYQLVLDTAMWLVSAAHSGTRGRLQLPLEVAEADGASEAVLVEAAGDVVLQVAQHIPVHPLDLPPPLAAAAESPLLHMLCRFRRQNAHFKCHDTIGHRRLHGPYRKLPAEMICNLGEVSGTCRLALCLRAGCHLAGIYRRTASVFTCRHRSLRSAKASSSVGAGMEAQSC